MADYNSDRTGSNIDLTLDKVDALDAKVQPTATGANVTGTLVSDGITVDGDTILDKARSETKGEGVLTVQQYGSTTNKWNHRFDSGRNYNFDHYNGSTWATRFQLGSNGDMALYEDNGTTAKMVWDASAESLGIGTSSPNQLLEVANVNGGATISISTGKSPGSASSKKYTNLDFSGYNNTVNARIQSWDESSSTGWGHLTFHTADGSILSEAMRIDKSGNVGIGTASPSNPLQVQGNIGLNNSAGTQVALIAGSLGGVFRIQGQTPEPMTLWTNNAERARIDSSGNLLVGTTSAPIGLATSTGITGFGYDANDYLAIARDGNPLILNRVGSDGTITEYRKDGLPVGSIGSNGGNTYFVGTSKGIRFRSSDMVPVDATGSSSDATIDLGISTVRWRDLYLSGGVYLGGTDAANKLDDYEEGTWTPTLYGSTGGTATVNAVTTSYTKIGNTVRVDCFLNQSDVTGLSGAVRLSGLPFTGVGFSPVIVSYCDFFDFDERTDTVSGFTESARAYANLTFGSASATIPATNATATSGTIMFHATYKTNQ